MIDLSERIHLNRTDRPDEWTMDDYAREAKKLEDKIAELEKDNDELNYASDELYSLVFNHINLMLEFPDQVDHTDIEQLLEAHDLERTRKGFWLGFEDARCHPSEMNILSQWEGTKVFKQAKALKEQA
tara:strand:- start:8 stop:391 length:384 start_codon:yes stop_codon:yes gene_type:complete